MIFRVLIPVIIWIILCSAIGADDLSNRPEGVFNEYLDAIVGERWDDAQSCWLPKTVAASNRLGITYTGLQNKYDCASPLVTNLDGIRDGAVEVSVIDVDCGKQSARLTARMTTSRDTVDVVYHTLCTSSGWLFTSPLTALTRDWKTHETRYASIHYTDEARLNMCACDALDRFVETTGKALGLTDGDLRLLEEKKIAYYLCDTEQIKLLTGHATRGMTDFPSDAIVSMEMPHYHELVHLLVNYALREVPLYTVPFMQEGTAACFGGRWGRSPGMIMYTGYADMAYELGRLDDILTYFTFHSVLDSPDISYPISALFVRYLIDEIGIEEFKRLYLELSGPDREVRSFLPDRVKAAVAQSTGKTWVDVEAEFDVFWPRYNRCGIIPMTVEPDGKPVFTATEGGVSVSLWETGDSLIFSARLDSAASGGVVLIIDPSSDISGSYVSRIFADHLPDIAYRGWRYGLKFSPYEAGLYDYACNVLLVGHVQGFVPAETFWDESTSTLSFAVLKSAVGREDLRGLEFQLVARE